LCSEVARATFGRRSGWPELLMLDNTDPGAVAQIEEMIDFNRTLFLVASKSGTTTETACFYHYFYGKTIQKGIGQPGSHFVAITDPGTRLVDEGRKRGFRRIFENPRDIGGRYSALSYFGLLPMALLGVDVRRVLDESLEMHRSCADPVPSSVNPGISLGALLAVNERRGRNKVTFVLSPSVVRFGTWAEQLLAESTGKEGRGLIPIDGEDLGQPEAYGDDRVFISIRLKDEKDPMVEKRLQSLEAAGHPVVRIEMRDALSLGAEFVRWETATAVAGAVIGINPFDEPNVSESKKNTADLLQEWRLKGAFGEVNPILAADKMRLYLDRGAQWLFEGHRESPRSFLNAFLDIPQIRDYVALLPYFLATPERDERLQWLRLRIRDRSRVATTLGYGPRYLHSTGQLHKGGPENGVFLMITADVPKDVPIPGEDYGFAVLQRAQALGDFRSLTSRGRRVVRIHLDAGIDQGLEALTAILRD
jgi:transaldolase/glucose-6-phosphate isomerase